MSSVTTWNERHLLKQYEMKFSRGLFTPGCRATLLWGLYFRSGVAQGTASWMHAFEFLGTHALVCPCIHALVRLGMQACVWPGTPLSACRTWLWAMCEAVFVAMPLGHDVPANLSIEREQPSVEGRSRTAYQLRVAATLRRRNRPCSVHSMQTDG